MLILNRRIGESIMLGEDIEVTILEIDENRIKIGIEAPMDVTILRKEIYVDVSEENKKSLELDGDFLDILKNM